MTISDAMLALLLAARIHGTATQIRATAKRCAQRLPRSKRFLMFSVIQSRDPLQLIALLITDHEQWHTSQKAPVSVQNDSDWYASPALSPEVQPYLARAGAR